MDNFQLENESLFETTDCHTLACGVDKFDKVYGLGYQVGHEDWSPYPRVNKLRQAF